MKRKAAKKRMKAKAYRQAPTLLTAGETKAYVQGGKRPAATLMSAHR